MRQHIVLVTGASSGIGKAIAEHLARQKGFYVFAGARSIDKLEAMRSANLEPLVLDVTEPEQIEHAVEHIVKTTGRLDVLVNNAGYGQYGSLEGVPVAEARRQFEVNVFGLVQVTQRVLPLMREQKSGRIINISSVAGKVATPMAGWYSASKHAVEALSDALRTEVKSFGINVVVIEPGAINTRFDEVALVELEKTSHPAYRQITAGFAKMVASGYRNAPQPIVIARTVHRVIRSRRPRIRYALPMDSRMFILMRAWLGDRTLDRIILSQLRG